MKLVNSKPVVLDNGNIRYRCRIEWDESPDEGPLSEHFLAEMLRSMAITASLRYCGPVPFETLKVSHNGSCWIAEMEAQSDQHPLPNV